MSLLDGKMYMCREVNISQVMSQLHGYDNTYLK